MDENLSNEAFVLSLLEGYGADEAEAMETEEDQVPRLDGSRNSPRNGLRSGASLGKPSHSP
jgi:hypothetical protein